MNKINIGRHTNDIAPIIKNPRNVMLSGEIIEIVFISIIDERMMKSINGKSNRRLRRCFSHSLFMQGCIFVALARQKACSGPRR